MNELLKYQDLILGWAKARLIIPNGKAEGQWLKGLEEIGELAGAIAKNKRDLVRDAIGDVFVCTVNFAALEGIKFTPLSNAAERQDTAKDNLINLNQRFLLLQTATSSQAKEIAVTLVVSYLAYLAQSYQLTLVECVDFAWNEIKDRKGTTTPDGVFVKE